jgi:RNA polymerase primary sigma factor
MTASAVTTRREGSSRRGGDSITWYLTSIGREPLLTPAEEIELGNQVQAMMHLVEESKSGYSVQENKTIKIGRRSKERMMRANLRLVVSVAKKYQGKGLELLDLIQEGSLGLERAVEKFDPTRGARLGYYSSWWIRSYILKYLLDNFRLVKWNPHRHPVTTNLSVPDDFYVFVFQV